MAKFGRLPSMAIGFAPVLIAGAMFLAAANPAVAATSVAGSAYGYQISNLTLLGGTPTSQAPMPTVSLASDASNSPQTASAPSGSFVDGPATLFTSNAITVSAQGSLGSGGSVTSSSVLNAINETTSGGDGEILSAAKLTGSCSASASGVSGSTTIDGGSLQTNDTPVANQTLAANPAPNTRITGLLHPFSGQTDHFVVVLNEQVTNANGTLTVNAAHEYLGYQIVGGAITPDPVYPAAGSSAAQGNLIFGEAVCGVATSALAPPVSLTAPATGSGGPDWLIGLPIAALGAGVLGGTGLIERRRAHARDSDTSD